jgi:hypothetical protein
MIPYKVARVIIAQYYVASGLQQHPAKIIKFITNNREYFPQATDEWLNSIKKELNVSNEDIFMEPNIIFAKVNTEEAEEAKLKREAEKLKIKRYIEKSKRDYGHGIKSRFETQPEIHHEKIIENTNKQFAHLGVTLKEQTTEQTTEPEGFVPFKPFKPSV